MYPHPKPPAVVFPPGLSRVERFQLQWKGRALPNGGRCEKSAACTRGYQHLGRAGMCNGGGGGVRKKAKGGGKTTKATANKKKQKKKPRRKAAPATFSKLFLAVRAAAAGAFAAAMPDHGKTKPGKGKVRFAAVWLSGERFTGGDVVLLHNPDGTCYGASMRSPPHITSPPMCVHC